MGIQIGILPRFLLCLLIGIPAHCTYAQFETSQVPVEATVPYGPTEVETNLPREGLVHLDVSVTDSQGNPYKDLAAKDFTLADNGEPQKIISFAASNQHPKTQDEQLTEVVLVIDEVDLSPGQLELVKAESITFLRKDGGQLPHPASVYWFTNFGLYATLAPTSDGNALAEAVARHRYQRKVWTASQVPDPLLASSIRVATEAQRNSRWELSLQAVYSIAIERRLKPGRKLVLWMGFGWLKVDRTSQYKDRAFPWLVELSTRLHEARVVISEVTARSEPVAPKTERDARTRTEPTISAFNDAYKNYLSEVRTPSELEEHGFVPYSHFSLPVLAIQSGGLVVDETTEISRSIERCVQAASMFYTLSFDPPHAAHPDEYHRIRVVIDSPGATARTNIGYYNQPALYDQSFFPPVSINVRELEQILATSVGEQDDALAKRLEDLRLSERLSSSLLALWRKRLQGKKSIAALVVLAGKSAFLDPPASEIVSDPAPDPEAQRRMFSRTVTYLKEVLPKLPDFFAVRTVTEFEQPSPQQAGVWKTALADQTLREAATEKAILRYRNGHEEQDRKSVKLSRQSRQNHLNLVGVFSPILGSVLTDVTRGGSTLTWSRWEQGDQGKEAVFRYVVRADNTHYYVQYCCLVGGSTFSTSPRYLGELTIDPDTGAILRLTLEAELGWMKEPNLTPIQPADGAATMIEYGPVEIGGREYICPRRSVSILRARTVSSLTVFEQTFEIYAPYETRLNDIVYSDYHKFGAEARMLPQYKAAPDANGTPTDSIYPNH
jgi:VWFA-related protein